MDVTNLIQFEDDYFETKERKLVTENVNFRPIMCHTRWFFDDQAPETAEKLQNQANFCYWTKDFKTAVSLYNKALENYFTNSPFMRRNLLESIARCHFQLGDLPKAQALAEDCLAMSYTVELKSSILNLLSIVYKSQNLFNLEKAALLQLISLHPQNYRVWLDLACCFSEISKRQTEENYQLMLMEAACLLRISMIITAMKNSEGCSALEMVDKRLAHLNLPENFLAAGKKFFSQDLLEEHLVAKPKDLTAPDEAQGSGVNGVTATSDDEKVWFKWVHEFLK
ncbi:uncharacterized protein C8orf76 homolog isoform X1 [Hetaerina americana]|uniref:uncharacterized protein C8orf76 homolog isoform X1 n=1 Tax=Hetaerina americana TaxID=62018 RepID=UPI003A7F4BD6